MMMMMINNNILLFWNVCLLLLVCFFRFSYYLHHYYYHLYYCIYLAAAQHPCIPYCALLFFGPFFHRQFLPALYFFLVFFFEARNPNLSFYKIHAYIYIFPQPTLCFVFFFQVNDLSPFLPSRENNIYTPPINK